jgi:FkbM family methyltransferase
MVFGFEPQNPIYKVLCGNLALNNCLNVRALNQAVGLTRSIIEIETCGYDENWNYGAFSISDGFNREGRFPGTAASEKVSIISLDGDDSISAMSRIDFLKIDAEGAEVAVLRGAQNMIDRHKPDIFVEANDKDVTNGSLKYLGKLGYVGFWFISNRFRVDNFNRNRFRIEGFDSNIIFRHPDRHGAGLNLPLAQDFSQISNGLPILNSFTR